jgi:hypothetical protein
MSVPAMRLRSGLPPSKLPPPQVFAHFPGANWAGLRVGPLFGPSDVLRFRSLVLGQISHVFLRLRYVCPRHYNHALSGLHKRLVAAARSHRDNPSYMGKKEMTDTGCNCHLMRGETCSSCMRQYAAEDTHHGRMTWKSEVLKRDLTDPDGRADGKFGNMAATERADAMALIQRKSESLRFIKQPAKSLREELRLGAAVYDDTP